MTICKPYDETTADDFRRLFAERFPGGDVAILETFLSNPARKEHPSTGSIAYDDDGSVKAILGLVPRRAYLRQTPLMVANGVAIAVCKDADRAFFPGFIQDAVREDGAGLFFVNTAIPPSRKRVKTVLGVEDGPASCAEIRERTLRGNGIVARVLRKVRGSWFGVGVDWPCRSVGDVEGVGGCELGVVGGMSLRCEREIVDADFNGFWDAYLKTNEGMISSRTAEELRWMFGKGLETGEIVLLTARKDGVLQGYAFCRRTDETAMCWRVVDLIALRNDEKVLEALVEGASDFLRKRTWALCLQLTGYPTWVQPLLKRLFPKSVPFGFNKCVWVYTNENTKSLLGDWVNAPNGWYGCPYDGDMCLM